jgi:hypothetical protein
MEYVFIILLQAIGISLHVLKKVMELDSKFPDDTLADVFTAFWKSDRITIIISGVLLILHLTTHSMVETYWPSVRNTSITIPFFDIDVPYVLASLITAFGVGFFGQMLFYRIMGKAEAILNKKIDDKK